MRRLLLGIALGALLVAPLPLRADRAGAPAIASHPIAGRLAVPLIGDHITEPASPITELSVELYWYNHGEFPKMIASSNPARQTRCDGTVTANFNLLRVEPKVVGKHADGTSLRGDPSEHFSISRRIEVFDKAPGGRLINRQLVWGGTWQHQNIKPHGAKASTTGWEADQASLGMNVRHGTWLISYTATGEISGNVLTARCQFDSAPPLPPPPPPPCDPNAPSSGNCIGNTTTTTAPATTSTTVAETTTTVPETTTTTEPPTTTVPQETTTTLAP